MRYYQGKCRFASRRYRTARAFETMRPGSSNLWRYCREHRGTISHSIPLTRGTLLRRAGAGALGLSAASLLAACGSSSSSGSSAAGGGSSSEAITGQAILANYPGWMGKHNLADFAKKYPGASIKMISNATSSSAEVVLQFKSKQYDFLLADTSDAGQASAANLITRARLVEDPERQEHRPAVPHGVSVGPSHRLRQGRHRLPARPGRRRHDHELARPLGADPQVLRPDDLHRPRARLHGIDLQVPGLLVEHHRPR